MHHCEQFFWTQRGGPRADFVGEDSLPVLRWVALDSENEFCAWPVVPEGESELENPFLELGRLVQEVQKEAMEARPVCVHCYGPASEYGSDSGWVCRDHRTGNAAPPERPLLADRVLELTRAVGALLRHRPCAVEAALRDLPPERK